MALNRVGRNHTGLLRCAFAKGVSPYGHFRNLSSILQFWDLPLLNPRLLLLHASCLRSTLLCSRERDEGSTLEMASALTRVILSIGSDNKVKELLEYRGQEHKPCWNVQSRLLRRGALFCSEIFVIALLGDCRADASSSLLMTTSFPTHQR